MRVLHESGSAEWFSREVVQYNDSSGDAGGPAAEGLCVCERETERASERERGPRGCPDAAGSFPVCS